MPPLEHRFLDDRKICRSELVGPLPHAAAVEIDGVEDAIEANGRALGWCELDLERVPDLGRDARHGPHGNGLQRNPERLQVRPRVPERNTPRGSGNELSRQTGERHSASLRVRQVGDLHERSGLEPWIALGRHRGDMARKSIDGGFRLVRAVFHAARFAGRQGIAGR